MTAYNRLSQALKKYEDQQNDDNAIPRFEPSPYDVRELIRNNTILIGWLSLMVDYAEGTLLENALPKDAAQKIIQAKDVLTMLGGK